MEEAGKDIEAAETAYKSLSLYSSRLEVWSPVLAHEIRPVTDVLFEKLEQLRAFQRSLYSKVLTLLGTDSGEAYG